MDNNWKRHVKTSNGERVAKPRGPNQPIPSAGGDDDLAKAENDVLTIGQRIFKTRITCNTMGKSGSFVFNVWLTELVKFLTFLGVMSVCTMAYTSNNNYYFIGLMKNKFIDSTGFNDVTSVGQLWDWLDEPFLDAIYDNKIDHNIMIGMGFISLRVACPVNQVVFSIDSIFHFEHPKKRNQDCFQKFIVEVGYSPHQQISNRLGLMLLLLEIFRCFINYLSSCCMSLK